MQSVNEGNPQHEEQADQDVVFERPPSIPQRIFTICESAKSNADHVVSIKRAIATFDVECQNYLRLIFINGPLSEDAIAEKLQVSPEHATKIGEQILETFSNAVL